MTSTANPTGPTHAGIAGASVTACTAETTVPSSTRSCIVPIQGASGEGDGRRRAIAYPTAGSAAGAEAKAAFAPCATCATCGSPGTTFAPE
ncbi:MAG: hypothetical protein M3349_09775, partial [Actinomycetota bacterium]|nr:hypothetical protein [Actinomycetota bacterium]